MTKLPGRPLFQIRKSAKFSWEEKSLADRIKEIGSPNRVLVGAIVGTALTAPQAQELEHDIHEFEQGLPKMTAESYGLRFMKDGEWVALIQIGAQRLLLREGRRFYWTAPKKDQAWEVYPTAHGQVYPTAEAAAEVVENIKEAAK